MSAPGRLVVGAVVALTFAFAAADGVAVAQPTSSPPVVILRAVAFPPGPAPAARDAPDAELIGKVLGTSKAGGAARQNQQDAIGVYSAALQKAAGARIVGAFVPRDAATTYTFVIRVSGSDRVPALETLAARAARNSGVPVRVEYMNTPSLAAMLAASDRFGLGIESAQDGVAGVGVDEVTSEVAIRLTRGVGDPDLARAQAAATFGAAGIPFRIDVTDEGWQHAAQ